MSRIAEKFAELRQQGRKALVTFITAGDPDLSVTEEIIIELERQGADIIELGVPFSDPMADGPTIQLSSERALIAGTTLPKILSMVKSARRQTQVPIVLMGYYNPVFLYGPDRFVEDAVAAGVDGVLLVDLPPEEAAGFKSVADQHGLDLIYLLTPTSDDARMAKVLRQAGGFIYYVSVTGVTGVRSGVAEPVFDRVAAIRKKTRVPVVVGFGIADAAQAGRVASVADGVVVGSAIVRYFEKFTGAALKQEVGSFVAALRKGIAA